MPITVVPARQGGGGGGFFDAASRSFEEFSKRAQEASMFEKELQLQKEQQKLLEKKFELEKNQHLFEQQRALEESKRRFAELALAQEEQRAADAARTRGLNIDQQRADQTFTLGQRELTNAERRTANDLRLGLLRDQRDKEQNDIARGRLDLEASQLEAQNKEIDNRYYLDQMGTIAQIVQGFGGTMADMPSVFESYFGTAVGEPSTVRELDLKAFETEAEDGETFVDFQRRKALDRAFGFFQISGENRTILENLVATSPSYRDALTKAAQDKELDMSEEDLAIFHAILRLADPSAFNPQNGGMPQIQDNGGFFSGMFAPGGLFEPNTQNHPFGNTTPFQVPQQSPLFGAQQRMLR